MLLHSLVGLHKSIHPLDFFFKNHFLFVSSTLHKVLTVMTPPSPQKPAYTNCIYLQQTSFCLFKQLSIVDLKQILIVSIHSIIPITLLQ